MAYQNEDPNFEEEEFHRNARIALDQVRNMISEMTFNADIIATMKTGGGLPLPVGELRPPIQAEFENYREQLAALMDHPAALIDLDLADRLVENMMAISNTKSVKDIAGSLKTLRASLEEESGHAE